MYIFVFTSHPGPVSPPCADSPYKSNRDLKLSQRDLSDWKQKD